MSDKTKRAIGGVLAGLVILTAVGNWVENVYRGTLAQAVEAVQAADRETVQAIAMASSALEIALQERQRGDSLEVVIQNSKAAADAALKRAATAKKTYETAVAEAPDTCVTVIEAADSTIAALEEAVDSLQAANETQAVQIAGLQTANDTLVASAEAQQRAPPSLRAAAKDLANAAQPSLFSKLLPKTGVGIAVGLDVTGRPAAVVGVTIGWSK
jgi:hypothetical protein